MARGALLDQMMTGLFALPRPAKRMVQAGADACLMILCFLGAMALRMDGFSYIGWPRIFWVLWVVIPVTIFAFARLGLYRAVIRYITGQAMQVIVAGVMISAAVMFATDQALRLPVPRSVPFIYAVLMLVAVGGVRFGLRGLFHAYLTGQKTPVLIYGAGDAGRQLLNGLRQGHDYAPVAFLDDSRAKQKTEVAGLRVFAPDQAGKLVTQFGAGAVLLALPSLTRAERRRVVARLSNLGVEVKTMPSMTDIVTGRARISDLRVVTPEDLLGRSPVAPDPTLMGRYLRGQSVMVTGAGGSIGSELCRNILSEAPRALILFDVSEYALYSIEAELAAEIAERGLSVELHAVLGSVQNARRLESCLRAHRVQTLFHAAAYKHVPLVEANIVEGIRNNVFGTETLADAAIAAGVARVTLISTDKAVRPTNVMGASKRLAEMICQDRAKAQSDTVFSMVRFGNVLGSSGSVIPRFRDQIEAGGPVTVTHPEITRYFMTIPEAAQLVIQAGAMARGGEVFLLDMGAPVRILDLAQEMIRLHGLAPYIEGKGAGDIAITFTGLRAGEKLFEELLIEADAIETAHPRIKAANEAHPDADILRRHLDDLRSACAAHDLDAIRAILRRAELGYAPEAAA